MDKDQSPRGSPKWISWGILVALFAGGGYAYWSSEVNREAKQRTARREALNRSGPLRCSDHADRVCTSFRLQPSEPTPTQCADCRESFVRESYGYHGECCDKSAPIFCPACSNEDGKCWICGGMIPSPAEPGGSE